MDISIAASYDLISGYIPLCTLLDFALTKFDFIPKYSI